MLEVVLVGVSGKEEVGYGLKPSTFAVESLVTHFLGRVLSRLDAAKQANDPQDATDYC